MSGESAIGDECNTNNLRLEKDSQTAGGTSYFAGAQNVTIVNSNFTHIEGDYINFNQNSGLGALERQISQDATFDSAARYPAGQCHPGTRTAIISEIRTWIEDPDAEHGVFWLHGSAGVGKSALMQTIAQLLYQANKGRYAGSFFFANGIAGREECSFLFPTLAYQVAVNLPTTRPLIEEALVRDSTLATKSMPSQIEFLLANPMRSSSTDFSQHTPTIIIDGLDECKGSPNQIQILSCIANALSSHIPLRFLIASRPEHWIKSVFSREPLRSMTRTLSQDDLFESVDAHDDLRAFLRDGFADIYTLYSDIILGQSSEPWPSPEVIDTLVDNASGQFIYASTVLKFVGHGMDFCDPRSQLDIVLGGQSTDTDFHSSAFSEIDKLYMRILSAYPRPESLKKVLGGLLLNFGHPVVFKVLLGVDLAEVYLVFNFLTSVLKVEENLLPTDFDDDLLKLMPPREIRLEAWFVHKSIKDFLVDTGRSGAFSVDFLKLGAQILTTFLKSTASCIQTNDFSPNEVYNNDKVLQALKGLLANIMLDNPETYDPFSDICRGRNILPLRSEFALEITSLVSDLYHQLCANKDKYAHGPSVKHPEVLLGSLSCIYWTPRNDYLIVAATGKLFPGLGPLLELTYFPKAIEQMFDSGYLLFDESLVHFVSKTAHSVTRLLHLPGVSFKSLVTFVHQTPNPIISSHIHLSLSTTADQQLTFRLMSPITSYFNRQIDSKYCDQYHVAFTNICHAGLEDIFATNILTFMEHEHADGVLRILDDYFNDMTLSDPTNKNNCGNSTFYRVIDRILGLEWTNHGRNGLGYHCMQLSGTLLKWRGRLLAREHAMGSEPLLRDHKTLRQQFMDLAINLFNAVLLPAVTIPMDEMFPELFKIPLDSDGQVDSNYVIDDFIIDEDQFHQIGLWLLKADCILPFVSNLPGSLGASIITRVTEVHFTTLAYGLYHVPDLSNPSSRSIPPNHRSKLSMEASIAVYYQHINPTKLILRTLRLMRYLWRIEHRSTGFHCPCGFKTWCISILKKYPEAEICSEERDNFGEWMEGLKEEEPTRHDLSMVGYIKKVHNEEDVDQEEIYYDTEEQ